MKHICVLLLGLGVAVSSQAGFEIRVPSKGIKPSEGIVIKNSLSFTDIELGTSVTGVAQIQNISSKPVTITKLTVPNAFSVDSGCVRVLQGNETCMAVVGFSPIESKAYSGSLVAEFNTFESVVKLLQSTKVTGTGKGFAPLSLAVSDVVIPDTEVGTESSVVEVEVTNNGQAESLSINVPEGLRIISDTCSTTVGAASKCKIQFKYIPTVAGTLSGNLTLSASGGRQVSKALSAKAFSYSLVSEQGTSVNVGDATSNGTPILSALTFRNNSTVPETLGLAQIQNVLPSGNTSFSLTTNNSCNGTTLAPNQTCTLEVKYTPGAVATNTATLTVPYANKTLLVDLTGNSVSWGMTVANQVLPSTNIAVTTTTNTVTVTNSGQIAEKITGITSSNATIFPITNVNCLNTTLAVGASCTFKVGFKPSQVGITSATVAIAGTYGTTPVKSLTKTIEVSGTGTAYSCKTPWNSSLEHGSTLPNVYANASQVGECTPVTLSCNNGTLNYPNASQTCSAQASDPYWNQVTLLASLNGNVLNTVTGTSGVANLPASLNYVQDKFGKLALRPKDAAGNTYSRVSYPLGNIHNRPMTIEMWINLEAYADGAMVGQYYDSSYYWQFYAKSANSLVLSNNGNGYGSKTFTVPNISLNTWTHVALQFDGINTQVFINGVKSTTEKTGPFTIDVNAALHVGASQFGGSVKNSLVGAIDEVRVTDGVARYPASGFTPPTREYPNF